MTTRDVTTYGAKGTGGDDGAAIQACLAACSDGDTVEFPQTGPVTVYGSSLHLVTQAKVTVAGQSRDTVRLKALTPLTNLLTLAKDGTVLSDIALDTTINPSVPMNPNAGQVGQGPGVATGFGGNNMTLRRLRIDAGGGAFSIYAGGDSGGNPSGFATGNVIDDLILTDLIDGDSISWSFQHHSRISTVVHHGSRLAVYHDVDLVVDGYQYVPGAWPSSANGFWITAPSSAILFVGYSSAAGMAGVIGECPRDAAGQPDATQINTDVALHRHRAPAGQLRIGDVDAFYGGPLDTIGNAWLHPRLRCRGYWGGTCGHVYRSPAPGATMAITGL